MYLGLMFQEAAPLSKPRFLPTKRTVRYPLIAPKNPQLCITMISITFYLHKVTENKYFEQWDLKLHFDMNKTTGKL